MLRSMSTAALSGLRTNSAKQTRWIQVSALSFNVKEESNAAPKGMLITILQEPISFYMEE